MTDTSGNKTNRTIIFLDIDGVLNTPKTWGNHIPNPASAIDHDKVHIVRLLQQKTGAEMVLSSTWRYAYGYERTLQLLVERGWPEAPKVFVGMTPVLHQARGEEISAWLRLNPNVTQYVILDDDNSAMWPEHKLNFVQINGARGVTVFDAEWARRMLTRD